MARSPCPRLSAALAGLIFLAITGSARAEPPPAPVPFLEDPETEAVARSRREVTKLLGEGRLAEAERAARDLHAREAGERGPRSPEAARALDLLVRVLWQAGKAHEGEALKLAREALEIKEARLSPGDPAIAATLNQVAVLLDAYGDLEGARRCSERALKIREAAYGPSHPVVANSLNSLAFTLKNLGDYAGAKPLFERALSIWEGKEGESGEGTAAALVNLAQLLQQIGDYQGARPLFERTIATAEKGHGSRSAQVAVGLNNLARLLHDQGDLPRAREAFERALSIWDRIPRPDPRELASCLNNLGWLCRDLSLPDLARRHLERALSIREERLGRDHVDTVWTLRNLAVLREDEGRLDEARDMLQRALKGRELALGPDHPFVAQDLVDLARLETRAGAAEPALKAALEAEGIAREHLRLTSRSFAERLGLGYAAMRASGLDVALSLAARGLSARSRREAWDALVRSRALILDEMSLRNRQWAGSGGDPETERLARSLASARQRLANLLVRGPGQDPPARHREALEEARRERERAEEALATRSVAFRKDATRERAGLTEVLAALPPRSALVGFARYRRQAERRGDRAFSSIDGSYLAFVIRDGLSEPEAVPLGESGEIEALVSRFQSEASQAASSGRSAAEAEAACRRAGEELRRKVWDPFQGLLEGLERVFLVPDGALHLVSFAALPSGDSYLVETAPLLHLLSAERDLLSSDRPRGEGLLVLGGPEFDERSLFAALSPAGKDGAGATAVAARFRGARPGCPDFQSMRFGALPASAREAEEVAAAWREAARSGGGAALSVFEAIGGRATEAAFKDKAPGRRVLHLATHGFFLGEGCPSALEGTRGFGGLAPAEERPAPSVTGDNPLVLSGLALAGANHRAAAGPDEEDGIVTAEEVAALDLSGVEWAVLSACDTGAGRVQAGEGVLGLRRAFQVAGARTLILSLWPVEDAAARAWMARLYRARFLEGLDTAESVREATRGALRDRRSAGQSTHPFHWAAFVAAGDWR